MKKTLLSAMALAAISVSPLSATAADIPSQGSKAYVIDKDGDVVRDRYGRCVRSIDWSMEIALPACEGGEAKPKPKSEPKITPVIAPKATPVITPAPAPTPVITPKAPIVEEPAPVRPDIPVDFRGFFDTDSAVLKQTAFAELDAYAEFVEKVGDASVKVTGHTDSVGNARYNQKLSERRANAVKDYLVSKGISADRITAEGAGEASPIASNDTDEGRAQNRRVVVEIVQ